MDIKFLRERIQTELESKLSLILSNRDDILKRIEDVEQEVEKVGAHTELTAQKTQQKMDDFFRHNKEKTK